VVIKYGGHAMGAEETAKLFAADAVLLKLLGLHPVVVHGGGPQISRMLDKAGVKSSFVDGLRVTDEATMEVAEMVLSGAINKEIANWITLAGREADVRGVGLSGKDARLIIVEKATRTKRDPDSNIESRRPRLRGRADPDRSAADREPDLRREDRLCAGDRPDRRLGDGETYNINADTVAGALAGALKAKRMLLLTDVAGVLDANKQLIRQATVSRGPRPDRDRRRHRRHDPQAGDRHRRGRGGVEAVVILDGRRPHALLVELFTEHGAGTLICAG
jgi:acetylglutamate kinase